MKAKIIGTDIVINVQPIYSVDGLRIEQFVNTTNGDLFQPHTVDIIPNNTDWETLRNQAAIAAMQGFLSRETYKADFKTLAKDSVTLVDYLIEELKNK